jgi:hypothetical protein
MSDELVLSEDEAMELLALLLTSARIQMDEPAQYGPLRLLTAAERLGSFIKARSSDGAQDFLKKITSEIPAMHMRMYDTEKYLAQLDDLCSAIAQRLVERHGLAEKQS